MDWEPLIEVASEARERAYAPFSSFKVGSAVATEDGAIHPGCNVENRTFGATICAERVAVTSAVARGGRKLKAVVVVTDTDPPAPPCGLCLEVLTEFGHPDLPLLLVGAGGARKEARLGDYLPHPFDFTAP
jgi:cytidine deaminase